MNQPTAGSEAPQDRVQILADMFLAGMRPSQAPAEVAKMGWTVTAEELAGLVIDAQERIIADARQRFELELAKSLDRLNDLYARSLRIQDYKSALACQKEINKVLDLYAKAKAQPDAQAKGEAEPDAAEADADLLQLLA